MPAKLSLTILSLIVLAGALLGAARVYTTVTSDHDGWDIFSRVDTTTDLLTVEPENLLSSDDRESIEHVVNEARGFGIPWSVWVVSRDELNTNQSADQIAEQRFAEAPVESAEGAGDGLLMAVIVSEPDQTQTEVAFVTGPNFYPKGGITPERLDYIADVQMKILIEEDLLGDAVIEGATWVEWTQLFEPTPDPPPTNLERGLRELLSPLGAVGIAGGAAVVAGTALLVRLLTWRGTGSRESVALNGVTAAAIARGRVDEAVVSGVMLDALDRGVLAIDDQGRVSIGGGGTDSRWDHALRSTLGTLNRHGVQPTLSNLAGAIVLSGEIRREVEDQMAQQGLYHPKSPIYTVRMRWVSATGTVLGLTAAVVSALGESAPALAASIALAGFSIIALIWNERRSWSTRAGSRAVRDWLDRRERHNDRERVLYETIMTFETVDLLPTQRSPIRPDARQMVSALER